MFYSEKLGLLFIAAPKTGSTSVEAFLLKIDPMGERFRITLADRIIDSRHVKTPSLGHATSREFRRLLGPQHYNSLRTFGFVRHPFEKLVSTYFFIRQSSISSATKVRSPKNRWAIMARQILGILLARLLPFWLWARFWPMKKCSDYFLDDDGNLNVDYLGFTSRLSEDLVLILQDIGYQHTNDAVPHANQSKHSTALEYIGSGRLRRYLQRRYQDDLALCELVKDRFFRRVPDANDLGVYSYRTLGAKKAG